MVISDIIICECDFSNKNLCMLMHLNMKKIVNATEHKIYSSYVKAPEVYENVDTAEYKK